MGQESKRTFPSAGITENLVIAADHSLVQTEINWSSQRSQFTGGRFASRKFPEAVHHRFSYHSPEKLPNFTNNFQPPTDMRRI